MRTYTDYLSGDGDSTIYVVEEPGDIVNVSYSLDGGWNSVTVTLSMCLDTSASPHVFTAIPSGAFTDDTVGIMEIPSGALFKAAVSGSGSPVPALTLTLRGDIRPVQ